MFKHLCPKCGKDSYSADKENFLPCPHCGFRFSGEYSTDRRHEERIRERVSIDLAFQGEHLDAKSIDFSKEGMGVEIFGRFQGSVGDTINVLRGDVRTQTKVMWTNRVSDRCLVGLKGLN